MTIFFKSRFSLTTFFKKTLRLGFSK